MADREYETVTVERIGLIERITLNRPEKRNALDTTLQREIVKVMEQRFSIQIAEDEIGIAMFHPEAVRFASYVSAAGGRQGTGMSTFAVGGMCGWALGPILTTPVVSLVGLRGTAIVACVPLAST